MQYIWKLYKWNTGNNRTELTQYLVAPVFLEPRCNEQLSTGEVILENVPTEQYPNPFPPKTKFTLERWVGDTMHKYFDYVVDHDDVEHYAGLPKVRCHRVNLIEPSVYAQGLHCDNFSLTYEQNDSTLNYKTVVSLTEKTVVSKKTSQGDTYQRPDWSYGASSYPPTGFGESWYRETTDIYNDSSTTYYSNSFLYRWTGLSALEITRNLNGLLVNDISFTMPIMQVYANTGGAVASYLFDCPTRCTVTRTTLKNGLAVVGTETIIISLLYSPASVQNINNRFMYNSEGKAGLRGTWTGSFTEDWVSPPSAGPIIKVFRESQLVNLPAMVNTNNTSNSSRTVSFNTTALTTQDFAKQLSYQYAITLIVEPYESGSLVLQYTAKTTTQGRGNWIQGAVNDYSISYTAYVATNANSFTASTVLLCRNMLEDAPSSPFLIKGHKYNCFDLFRRAMLTCDTQIFDNNNIGLDEKRDTVNNDIGLQYPIIVHTDWIQRLKQATMYESVFENKNLWEVLQQIGHYLHAIPHLEFSRDGKDRFVLKFKQLGGTHYGNNDSTIMTIFNSQALDTFFTQYDAYVSNIFSPQNEIDEWLVCKTSDGSYLVSNNTAELQTKYGITELVQLDITYNGQTKSALEFVFEKTVYDTLSARTDFVPAKWTALYFSLGTNKILGLNYVPPTTNNDGFMALKTIIGRLFNSGVTDSNLRFNNLKFHVRYKTQDTLRLNQIRPDLERFIKSSEYENYPHHEQFFNQQDKIIDSERFSANLWGRLVRVANGVFQCQEYASAGQEKEPGDLINIEGDSYYITECENEYYADASFQKVTYSKNFNQLSNIVTIPSEPRFFEISERSMIRREVRLLDFLKLSTSANVSAPSPTFINKNSWHKFIRDLIFADSGNPQLPNFAYTKYKADIQRTHINLPNNDTSVMFPSSEADIIGGIAQPKPSAQNRAVIVPILHFPLRNSIVFEWDMEDNFKAADCVDTSVSGENNTADDAYYSLQPVRYCDVYGRADLFDFKLFYKNDWSDNQLRRLPFADGSDFAPTAQQSIVLIPDNLSVGLDKDNREALSFNYQLNLLHEPHKGDTEDFIIFANLFGKKNGRLRAVLLNTEASMFNEVVRMDVTTIVADNVQFEFIDLTNAIRLDFSPPAGVDLSAVKSIILYDIENSDRYAHIAKNVAKLPNVRKLQSWWIYPVFSH